ncbi:MAG: type I-C CRISPR-associated protein Cas8c/Csd1 [Armatimonadetes bacterium]|nr:type I-C CRISPR-associated protein Cas8c/Csd1 [Armatimonadota bacterium]
MILKRIVEFAERQNPPPKGYQQRFITKIIQLDAQGSLLGVLHEGPDHQGKRTGWKRLLPQESPRRGSKATPRLIADNAEYVLGMVQPDSTAQRAQERHDLWIELLEKCAEAVSDPEIHSVLNFVRSGGLHTLAKDSRIGPDDDLTFEVDGKDAAQTPGAKTFWASHNRRIASATKCLVTGVVGPVVDRMPAPINGLPEGQTSGTALVSVNFAAGESYGLKASLNSPISEDAAEELCDGLNQLLNTPLDPSAPAGRRRKHALVVGPTVFVVWTKKGSGFDFFSFLDEPSEEDVKKFLSQPLAGTQSQLTDEDACYVLALSANAARIVVRDYQELTLKKAKRNLARWFEHLDVVGPDGGDWKPAGVFRLAASLYRKAQEIPAHVPAWLVRTALLGDPLPPAILTLALKRNLAMQGPFSEFNGRKYLSTERIALIKFALQQSEDTTLKSLVNDHPEPAYHCGRLLAVLEQIQRAALGDINATVVDRYYGAACASPGTILGNLVNDAQAHLSKLRKEKGDYWAQAKLADILTAIGESFPLTLTLREQGYFALGFYHQKAEDMKAAKDRKEKSTSNEDSQKEQA